jgi:hypothetical protein
MKVHGGFGQSDNAQAALEVGSMLIVGQHLSLQANDKQQPVPRWPPPRQDAPVVERVAYRFVTARGKPLYGLRKQTDVVL